METLALLIPSLGISVALGWIAGWPGLVLVGVLYASEAAVWILASRERPPQWLNAKRYTLAEARSLPTIDRRPLLTVHWILFALATTLLLHGFSFESERLFVLILVFCQAQVLAHELSHTRGLRALAEATYAIIGGTEGYLNHVRHHHAHYATAHDELNAFFDETYYGLGRRIAFQWRNARRLDPGRLRRGYALQGLAALGALALGGGPALLAYGISVVIARFFIEAFSVITHYRLDRRSGFSVAAWEVRGPNLFDYVAGYRVTRHPAHHAAGHLPPVRIAGTPQMPAFFLLLTLVWLSPPRLRRILDRELAASGHR
jgi:hypothetical protein